LGLVELRKSYISEPPSAAWKNCKTVKYAVVQSELGQEAGCLARFSNYNCRADHRKRLKMARKDELRTKLEKEIEGTWVYKGHLDRMVRSPVLASRTAGVVLTLLQLLFIGPTPVGVCIHFVWETRSVTPLFRSVRLKQAT
jgi:hypothetical protein